MPEFATVAIIVIGLLILILFPSVLLVKEKESVLIERLGKYSRTIETPGIYFLLPFIDRAVEHISHDPFFVSKKVKKQEGIDTPYIVTYKIKVFDEMLYAYGSLDAVETVHDYYIQTKLANMESLQAREELETYAEQFGFNILNIEVYNEK